MDHTDIAAQLDEIRGQSHLQEFETVDHALARRIGMAIADIAVEEQLPVTVAVHLGEQRLFHAAFAGTTAEHDGWVHRKRRTTLLHDASSMEVALRLRLSGRRPDWLDPTEYAVAGGAVPLRVSGLLVGVVALSGLVSSARADHDVVIRGLIAVRSGGIG